MRKFISAVAFTALGVVAQQEEPLFKALTAAGNPFDQSSHDLFANPWFAKEVLASKSLTDA
jgi:hypothetical protein